MDNLKVRVNAKINMTLDVVGDFGAGYHKLDMTMISIGIFDVVTVSRAEKISVLMDMKECDESNTAYKVAKICMEEYNMPPVKIEITKGIPFGGGVGGSSADASATIYCLQKMFGLNDNDARQVAARVGSDVNFMLKGGFCRAIGKGDDLCELPFKDYCIVLAKGKTSAMTKEVFDNFDKYGNSTNYTEKFVNALASGEELRYIGNGLQKITQGLCEDMSRIIDVMSRYSHYVCMTGSGTCVFAVMDNMDDANALADSLKGKFNYVKACTTLPYGIKEF